MRFKETEVGRIPEDWEVDDMENSLDEIIDYRGKTPEKSETGIPTLSAKSVKNGYIDYSRAYFISKETYKKFMVRGFPQKGDILLTTEAPLGLVAKLDRENIAIAQRILTLRGKKDYLINEYLQYYLMSVVGQHQLTSRETGTTVKGIKQKEFRKCLIPLPPIKEQKAIANILSTLDEKIETNNKINKNLESMAQEIFKHWFVDFEFPDENGKPYKSSGGVMVESEMGLIPEGWEVVELNEIANLTMGLSPKSDSYNFDQIGTPLLNGAADFENSLINAKKHTSAPTRLCKKDDLVFCIRATIGNITFADKEYCLGRGVASIAPRNDTFTGLIYYNLLMSINQLIANATGSVILGLSKPDINNMKLVLPDKKTLKHFSDISNNILKDKQNNEIETKAIIELRNTLLPKLMSGQLRVPLDK